MPEIDQNTAAATVAEPSDTAWVTETPEELEYQLVVYDQSISSQTVELTRAEYIALKDHLAVIRGLKPCERATT